MNGSTGSDTESQLPMTERQSGTAVYGPEPFFDGFEAAMFSFKSAGWSKPHCCAGAVKQFPRKLELPNPISRR